MRRRAVVVGFLVLAGVLVAAAGAWFAFSGAGGRRSEAVIESVAVGPFSGVAIDGSARVTLVQGTDESVTVELPPRSRGRVRVDIRDGVLRISYPGGNPWWDELFGERSRPPRIAVHYRSIDRVSTAGVVQLTRYGHARERPRAESHRCRHAEPRRPAGAEPERCTGPEHWTRR